MGSMSLNTGRFAERAVELERTPQNLQSLLRDLQGSYQLGIVLLMQKELIR